MRIRAGLVNDCPAGNGSTLAALASILFARAIRCWGLFAAAFSTNVAKPIGLLGFQASSVV